MSRVEENREVLENINKLSEYDHSEAMFKSAVLAALLDISVSLAVIADSLEVRIDDN